MAISDRVFQACQRQIEGDSDSALHDICSAIERTAKLEYGRGGGEKYKAFISDNFPLITESVFGSVVGQMRFAYSHPDLKPDSKGTVSTEQIFYHVVRCGLYHESTLPDTLHFHDKNFFRANGGSELWLPKAMVTGLIIAVVCSPVNDKEIMKEGVEVKLAGGFIINLNLIWGKRDQFRELLTALKPFR